MKTKYLFQDEYFAISESGLHLLRNRFEYETFSFSQIQSVKLKRGRAVKNWIGLLIFGLLFFLGGIYSGRGVFNFFTSDQEGTIDILIVVMPFFLLTIGGFTIFKSLKQEDVLSFKIKEKEYNYSVKSFSKHNLLEPLINHLSTQVEFKNELK